mmetsp:Transcript_31451/g.67936  ORF Transcript_31451/g.67936 Transcript_31451/m.67936 type:complete len:98 (-) Transcript_31451:1630-1923(-)
MNFTVLVYIKRNKWISLADALNPTLLPLFRPHFRFRSIDSPTSEQTDSFTDCDATHPKKKGPQKTLFHQPPAAALLPCLAGACRVAQMDLSLAMWLE